METLKMIPKSYRVVKELHFGTASGKYELIDKNGDAVVGKSDFEKQQIESGSVFIANKISLGTTGEIDADKHFDNNFGSSLTTMHKAVLNGKLAMKKGTTEVFEINGRTIANKNAQDFQDFDLGTFVSITDKDKLQFEVETAPIGTAVSSGKVIAVEVIITGYEAVV